MFEAYDRGYDEGFKKGRERAFISASLVISMNKDLTFEQKMTLMRELDKKAKEEGLDIWK